MCKVDRWISILVLQTADKWWMDIVSLSLIDIRMLHLTYLYSRKIEQKKIISFCDDSTYIMLVLFYFYYFYFIRINCDCGDVIFSWRVSLTNVDALLLLVIFIAVVTAEFQVCVCMFSGVMMHEFFFVDLFVIFIVGDYWKYWWSWL